MSTLVQFQQNVPIDQVVQNGENAMLSKISTGDARRKFANIINRVAYGKESFVLTRRGEPLAALVSMDDFMLLQEIEDRIDIEEAWKARAEPGENIPWEKLRKELDL